MPFTSAEISDAGKSALDFYLKNKPVDQVGTERPLMKALKGKQKSAPGGKQFIVEQLRKSYDSNFQWFNGSQVVTYNKRQTLEQANFAWRSAHDGFALNEDRLLQNGITVTDDKGPSSASDAEKIQLTNLFEEQTEALDLGFDEQFDQALHIDGTQSTDAIVGLDALVSLTPTTGTVGGIDRALAANTYFRNNVATGLTTTTTTGDILQKMETAWRQCVRVGGQRPDLILMGSTFNDGFRNFMLNTFGRVDFHGVAFGKNVDTGTEMLTFHGVPMQWDPVMQDLDTRYAPATPWEKRCYFLNTRRLRLRPLDGQDRISRKPPRAYDKYESTVKAPLH